MLSLVRDRRTTVYLKDFFFPVENNPEAIEAIEAIKREANFVSMWQENITLVEEIVVDEPTVKVAKVLLIPIDPIQRTSVDRTILTNRSQRVTI